MVTQEKEQQNKKKSAIIDLTAVPKVKLLEQEYHECKIEYVFIQDTPH